MPPVNLIKDPWIPARSLSGNLTSVSLETLFSSPDTLADLVAPAHERISLLRLFICITQRALDAPASCEPWDESYGDDLEKQVGLYLSRPETLAAFELFSDSRPFLQTIVSRGGEPVKASKLVPHLSSGNNPTLLDHDGQLGRRPLSPERLATALLSFQCFYPLYGAGYHGKGPCVDGNMVHTFVQGANLRETILNNCLSRDVIESYYPLGGMGRPIWELDLSRPEDACIATQSYLGRLVPCHREIKLLPDCESFLLGKGGLVYPTYDQAREPSATIVVRSKKEGDERRCLSARLDRAIWRDLHSLTVLHHSAQTEQGAPMTLVCHWPRLGHDLQIWTGALVTDLKAKIYDTVESTITVPAAMFSTEGRSVYEAGIAFADLQSKHIYGALKQYCDQLKHDSPPIETAQRHFWNTLEQSLPILLRIVRNPSLLEGAAFGEADDDWTQSVKEAARKAYDHACPSVTPKQLQAYAAGLRVLHPKPKRNTPAALV